MHALVNHRGAWLPWDSMYKDDASRRLVGWIDDNIGDEEFSNRVVMTPLVSNPVDSPPVLATLARNAPQHGRRSPGPSRGGLVVSAWPREPDLRDAISRARNATLVVFPWGEHLRFDGWAAAVQAFNAATGESTPPLSDELDEEFRTMLMYSRELGQGAKRGPQREIPQSSMTIFKQAGLTEDFVVTYCIGLGYLGDHQNMRNHYREALPRA